MMSRSNTARPSTASRIRISSSTTHYVSSKPASQPGQQRQQQREQQRLQSIDMDDDDVEQAFVQAISEYVTEDCLREASGKDNLEDVEYIELQADTSESSLARLGQLLPNLKELKMVSSNITTIRDLGTALTNLQVLWMSKCNLSDLSGISMLTSLRELYVAFNDVSECSPLSMLEQLEVLDLEGNSIRDTAQVEYLSLLPRLRSLSLDGNPLLKAYKSKATYRQAVFDMIPTLALLDDVAKGDAVEETTDAATSILIPTLLKKRPDTTQDPSVRETVRPGTARPATKHTVRPRTASTALARESSVGGVDDDDEDGDTNDGSSSLTHGSAVAFQGNPLKALLARRKQTSIDGDVDGTPLEELMMSVGLFDEEEEEDDPFAEMTREQVFDELRSWRERFAALSAEDVARKAKETAAKNRHAEEQQAKSNTASPRRRPETARPARARRVPAPPSAALSQTHTQMQRRQPQPPATGRARARPAPPGMQRPQTSAGPRVRRLRSMPGRRLPVLRPLSGTAIPSGRGGATAPSSGGGNGGGGDGDGDGLRHLPQPPGRAPRPPRRPNRSAHL
ncbi:hypothetical protein PTSG_11969 [Salpingoeca rosetta]|uniref:Uncharacterized protein n=1 Tax=Salpingoeca rosetta (strain ATCC 50818 / BSB-021) TaxID=946362 RepID=F2U4A4_SALR5|nr:uncharacterized protein PTSG_11969 [Salpingoeca rosetta]EGD82470.1 hypothetical protein PTSG_11969 [Salpingoeca rosetta]|eukprot:XP_004995706.1 hypothetical protein PTSG_11969 [Salpingoeca rosetta]